MFADILAMIDFAFAITGPIFLLVTLGALLKYWKVIDAHFIDKASKLVFVVALPVLMFMSMVKTDIQTVLNPSLLLMSSLATLFVFFLLSVLAPYLVKNYRERGIFIQGAFRGNTAIVGLAFCFNAYGNEGLAKASILMSILSFIYTTLSVYTLSVSLSDDKLNFKSVLISVIKNPIIVSIILGMGVNMLGIPIPTMLMHSGEYIAQLTLPLALICIGGTLSLAEMKHSSHVAFHAVLAKLVVTPILIVLIAYFWGFSQIDIGILFLMVSTPTAAASYVMVQAMDGNGKLAANIVVLSTLASLFTVSVGLVILKALTII